MSSNSPASPLDIYRRSTPKEASMSMRDRCARIWTLGISWAVKARAPVASSCALALFSLFPTPATACHCFAHFEVRNASGTFKAGVPEEHFSVHHEKGNLQNNNQCRRDAREEAQSCMSAIWRARWSPGELPGECTGLLRSGGKRFRGPVPKFVKRDIERAVCCQPSDFGGQHDIVFDIFKRTHGDPGCGPNLRTVESRLVHDDYRFDCSAIRDRENRDGRFCGPIVRTKTDRYDRPGFDREDFPSSTWQECRAHCENEDRFPWCRAWTWVPRIQGDSARCWLKNKIPWAERDGLSGIDRMVSGTRASPN